MWAIMSAERTPGTDLTGCVFNALTPSGSCPIAWVAAPSACALARPGFDATWPSRCSMICLAVTDMMPRWFHPGKHTANSKHARPENLGCSRRSRCPPSLHPQCGRRCTKIANRKVTPDLSCTIRVGAQSDVIASLSVCMCVCVCVCARARARLSVYLSVCICLFVCRWPHVHCSRVCISMLTVFDARFSNHITQHSTPGLQILSRGAPFTDERTQPCLLLCARYSMRQLSARRTIQ